MFLLIETFICTAGGQRPNSNVYSYDHYNSPNHQPQQPPNTNGPTYTQLNTGMRQQNTTPYHNAGPPANPGLWGGWQGAQATEGSTNSGSPVTQHPVSTVPPNPNAPQGQEFSDMMMQMLDQNGPAPFEDMNLFSTPFE